MEYIVVMTCIFMVLQVKEAAAWAAGYIARSNQNLARAVVDAGAIPHLVLCLQEPEISVR